MQAYNVKFKCPDCGCDMLVMEELGNLNAYYNLHTVVKDDWGFSPDDYTLIDESSEVTDVIYECDECRREFSLTELFLSNMLEEISND